MVRAVARKPMKNKLLLYIEKVVCYQGNRSLSSTRNFDFKRYTPRPEKLLRATVRLVSIWSLRMLQSLKKNKNPSAIVAILWKPLLSDCCMWNAVIVTIAEVWFPYDHNDCWSFFFFVQRLQLSLSYHMEISLYLFDML